MRPFQIAILGIFAAVGIGGLLMFALFKGFGQEANPYGDRVVMWGTLDDAPFVDAIGALQRADANFQVVTYVQKDARTFEQELLNALAEGVGPDIIVLSHDMLISQRGKLYPLSYDMYPERTFRDTYVDGAEIFMLKDGIYALPIAIDPLIQYWNRSLFATRGFANPPRTWETLASTDGRSMVEQIVEKDFQYNVTRAAVAFGEYANVRNAKAVLSMLMLQSGSNMITDTGEKLMVEINTSATNRGIPPAQAAVTFYTQFSNPVNVFYTWNRSLQQDRDMFLSGELALYYGFASERNALLEGNPNLDFDVTEVPQTANVRTKKGYGTIYGMALVKNSRNLYGALAALYQLGAQQYTEQYARAYGFGAVYRASHQGTEQDPFRDVVQKASLVARGWLDPNPSASDNIFKQMIEDATSNRRDVSGAVADAEARLRQLVQ